MSEQTISFTSGSGNYTIQLGTVNPCSDEITVSSGSNWITTSLSNGFLRNLTIYVTANTGASRTGTILINKSSSYPADKETLTITQEGCVACDPGIISGPSSVYLKTTATYSVTPRTGVTFTWQVTGGNITSGQNTSTITVVFDTSGSMIISVTGDNGCSSPKPKSTLTVAVNFSSVPTQTDQNYVVERTIVQDNVNWEDNIVALPIEGVQETVDYYDGLGRPIQKVITEGSPTKKDIIQPIAYDAFGRERTKYLPYTGGNTGTYKSTAISDQSTFYTSTMGYIGETAPFSQVLLENSPLNRVLKQGSPGIAWQPVASESRSNTEHVLSVDYLTNTTGEVIKWDVTTSNTLQMNGFYNPATLYVTQSTDENMHPAKEYKDMDGHVILKSVFDGTIWLQTYYVYDDLGLLRFVIPPKATIQLSGVPDADGTSYFELVTANKSINAYAGKSYTFQTGVTLTLNNGFNFSSTASSSFSVTKTVSVDQSNIINQLVYQYQYDKRGHMVLKKLPGADWVYMIYDGRDRLVLTQDGNMRAKQQWMCTLYDQLNRPAMTGFFRTNCSYASFQSAISTKSYIATTTTANSIGYTLEPFIKNIQALGSDSILSVFYYDNYSFPGVQPFDTNNNISGYLETIQEGAHSTYYDNVIGQVTGTKTKVIGESTMLTNTNYYDDKSRVIQSQKDLYGGGLEIQSSKYDFVGKITQSRNYQIYNGQATYFENWYHYDHAGRFLYIDQQINGMNHIVPYQDIYNELGQLNKKWVNNQSLTYNYNIRGWLSQINDPSNLGSNLFAMKLLYNDNSAIGNLGSQNQFNGNISGMIVNRKNDNGGASTSYGYGYSYDALNRLTSSKYGEGSGFVSWPNKYNESGILYDAEGNIKALQRNSGAGQIDNLTYTYKNGGNQLQSISDASVISGGFTDVSGDDYDYDLNGNLIKDNNKSITGITYNLLNLPYVITKDANNTIQYIYDAKGTKLCKLAKVNGSVNKRYYCGAFEYDNTKVLSLIHFDEGIVEVSKDASNNLVFNYEFYLKDHLGNTRAVCNSSGALIQRSDYYAFGMTSDQWSGSTSNKYLYNGKEIQQELGLGWYDYGARFYDPQIGRFTTVDPLAEEDRRWSPYCYGLDNSIRHIDPDGCSGWDVVQGVLRGAVDNVAGTNTRASYEPDNADDYNSALNTTDNASAAVGVAMVVGGTDAAIGGGAAALATGGTTLAVSAVGVGVAVLGTGISAQAVMHMAKGNHYGEKSNSSSNTSKGSKDLVKDAQASQEKKAAAGQRQSNREAQTTRGNSRTGNNNQGTRGSHSSTKGGDKGGKHDTAEKRRAREQKKADDKK